MPSPRRPRARSTSANFDFGGQFDFGQFRLRPISISANFNFGQFLDVEFLDHTGWGAPKGGAPKGGAPKGGTPKGRGPHVRAFFSLSCPRFRSFSGGLLVECWWCLKRRDPLMCTFGVLGLSCETPAAPKPLELQTTAREPKRAHFRVPAFKNTTKIPRKDPQEREERMKTVAGEG